MSYRCEICTSVVPNRTSQLKVIEVREVQERAMFTTLYGNREQRRDQDGRLVFRTRTEIAKEIKVCANCCEGHRRGINHVTLRRINGPKVEAQTVA